MSRDYSTALAVLEAMRASYEDAPDETLEVAVNVWKAAGYPMPTDLLAHPDRHLAGDPAPAGDGPMTPTLDDETRELLWRLRKWTDTYGAALCPTAGRADTFGDGMRAAKDQVRHILAGGGPRAGR